MLTAQLQSVILVLERSSLRVRTVERQPFMDKPCDWEAGKKHRCTSAMLRHLRVAVMEMCEQADLNQINLLEAQGDHVSEREYWAQRRGQRRLDHANAKLAAEGQQPTQTVYQTELDKLRKQIYAVLNKTTTFEEFSALLMQEHGLAIAVAGVLTAVLCPIFAALL